MRTESNVSENTMREEEASRSLGSASQWELIKLRYSRHKLAVISAYILVLLYLVALFAEFVAPQSPTRVNASFAFCPPQIPRISLEHGLYVYPMTRHVNPVTLQDKYTEDRSRILDLGFFVKGDPYELWGIFPMRRHLLGLVGAKEVGEGRAESSTGVSPAEEAAPELATATGNPEQEIPDEQQRTMNQETRTAETFYLFGADRFGRDLYSRIVYGARISLSVGLVGIAISFTLGCLIGGISGYAGGWVDNLIQRLIEMMNAVPTLPLWIVMAGMMPVTWSPLTVYFAITVVLSLLGWTGLARVVRGKIISLRQEDYAMAARLLGAGSPRILARHLLPGMTSHILVSLSMTLPAMILGETSLSFLGLGLRPPVVSWGVLLQDCMQIEAVVSYSWLLTPVFFIILAVMCFNFVGDGLRDAADPYH